MFLAPSNDPTHTWACTVYVLSTWLDAGVSDTDSVTKAIIVDLADADLSTRVSILVTDHIAGTGAGWTARFALAIDAGSSVIAIIDIIASVTLETSPVRSIANSLSSAIDIPNALRFVCAYARGEVTEPPMGTANTCRTGRGLDALGLLRVAEQSRRTRVIHSTACSAGPFLYVADFIVSAV